MVPARQRLEAGDRAVFEPHDRLIQDGDLVALQRAAQIGFDRQPVGLARTHRDLEDVDAVAAAALGVIHRQLGVLEHFLGALRLGRRRARGRSTPVRNISRSLNVIGARSVLRMVSANAVMRADSRSDSRISAELVAGEPRQRVLRLDQPAEPTRQRQQDRIADRHADGIVDLLEAVEIDHHHGRRIAASALAKPSTASSRSINKFAVRQAGQIVVHGVVQQPLLGGLELGDVGDRADEPHHLAVRADHRPRPQREPEIVAVGGAHAEILRDAPASLLEHAVERGAEAVAVELMQHVEPLGRRTVERAGLEAERRFGLRDW